MGTIFFVLSPQLVAALAGLFVSILTFVLQLEILTQALITNSRSNNCIRLILLSVDSDYTHNNISHIPNDNDIGLRINSPCIHTILLEDLDDLQTA